ncbi:MAG TPA: NifU family protein, partial [Pyrinomonadaceae bacterium]|nr:NifU family protein [Pyrinomonadaceae bacterium]
SCSGCPSSSLPLKQAIEKAIFELAPDIAAIEAKSGEQPPKARKFVQIKGIQPRPLTNNTTAAAEMF